MEQQYLILKKNTYTFSNVNHIDSMSDAMCRERELITMLANGVLQKQV